MNSRSLLTSLLILCLVSCRPSDRTSQPRATLADPTKLPQQTTVPAYENPRERSPDGFWHATMLTPTAPGAAWFASPSGKCEVRTTLPSEFGAYSLLASWSPDSNHVAFFGYTFAAAGTPPSQIMILELDRSTCAGNMYRLDVGGDMNTSELVWSPNGYEIAMAVSDRTILIANAQAQVVNRITLELPDRNIVSSLEWKQNGLTYAIWDDRDPSMPKRRDCDLTAGCR